MPRHVAAPTTFARGDITITLMRSYSALRRHATARDTSVVGEHVGTILPAGAVMPPGCALSVLMRARYAVTILRQQQARQSHQHMFILPVYVISPPASLCARCACMLPPPMARRAAYHTMVIGHTANTRFARARVPLRHDASEGFAPRRCLSRHRHAAIDTATI